jgi:hypothetical protein
MPVFALSIHAGYACRSSGACCTSGWEIAVEPAVEDGIRRSGLFPEERHLVPRGGLPEGARSVLAVDPHGRCLFHEPEGLCGLHRRLGHGALPISCRQFPRVALLTPNGVSVSLSHYCPTAAAMLFDRRPLAIVRDPAGLGGEEEDYEGLDAREALPPLLRPDALLGWDAHALFERHAVDVLGQGGLTAEQALQMLGTTAEAVRRWSAADGLLFDHLRRTIESAGPVPAPPSFDFEDAAALRREAAAAVPEGVSLPPALREVEALAEADARLVAPGWTDFAEPVRRYLAARAFAGWCALQGEGLRTTVLSLWLALGVLRVEAARACAAAAQPLDADRLREAVRSADLLLLHLVAPLPLARRLSRAERDPALQPS